MGGGGGSRGGYFGKPVDQETIETLRSEAEKRAKSEGLEAEVNGYLKAIVASVTDRDVDTINSHLELIRSSLGKDIEGMENLLFGGSVAKHTYVDGLSDVDSLVLLKNDAAKEQSPNEFIRDFAASLAKRLSSDVQNIEKGALAVTVNFRDGTIIQLLPAYRIRNQFAIANESGSGWRYINPKEFAETLSARNRDLGYRLIPTIKLIKVVNSQLPTDRRLESYHIEALAIDAFKDYRDPLTFKTMITHFFKEASERVKSPMVDKTGQSKYVDDELGPAGNLNRLKKADSLARIARRMQNAVSLEQWESLIEGDL